MSWFSRLYRPTALPVVSLTVTALTDRHAKFRCDMPWQVVFSALDDRGIPATWAVPAEQTTQLASLAVASLVTHELAFLSGPESFSSSIARFRGQQSIANTASLPIRTLLVPSLAIHPSLLEQLAVAAVVPSGPQKFSRTGQFRSLAWKTWEAPVTDRIALPLTQTRLAKLCSRLEQVKRNSTRLHLVIELSMPLSQHDLVELADWLDLVADYQLRGWLKVATVGNDAWKLNQSIRPKESRRQAA